MSNAYSSAVLFDNPIRYYRLDESSGTVAHDLGSQGRNGTLNGGVTLAQAGLITGDSDTAMLFDGSTGYISMPTTGLPAGSSTLSLEFWFQVSSSLTGFQMVLSLGTRVAGEEINFYFDPSSKLDMELFGTLTIVGSAPSLNTPHHVVLTYDGSTFTYYLDKVSQGTSSATANITYGGANIGAQASPINLEFPGVIDEVAIYAGALSAQRVAAHYNTGILSSFGSLAASVRRDGRVRK